MPVEDRHDPVAARASGGAHGIKGGGDLDTEVLGLAREFGGRGQPLGGRGARPLGGLRHPRDVTRHLARAGGRLATLCTISCVAAPCSSAAVEVETLETSSMRRRMPSLAVTA